MPAVQFHDFLGERESEAVTAQSAVAGLVHLIKTLKDMYQVFRRDADTGIGNLTARFVIVWLLK